MPKYGNTSEWPGDKTWGSESRVTPLNQAAAAYTVDFSLSSYTCLVTTGQNTSTELLVRACKLTGAGNAINLGRLTGNKRYAYSSPHPLSSYSTPVLPHQSSLLCLGYIGSCPELYFVKEYNIFISNGLAYGEINTVQYLATKRGHISIFGIMNAAFERGNMSPVT